MDAHIMQDNTLTIEARALYAILASYSKADTRECAPSVKTLVKVSGISKDRFYKHMGQLVERGIVEKLALTDGGTRKCHNAYRLNDNVV